MDLSFPTLTTNSPLIPVFGDNVQDLLGTGTLNVNPTGIIVVNSIADTVDDPGSGVITLRDAINQANGDNGEDLIVFERSLFTTGQTISLNLGELDITHSLDIIAPRDSLTGANLVEVSGNKASRVFEIETGATVTLSGLIVESGSVMGDNGGGIKNSGTLALDNSIVRNGFAIGGSGFTGGSGGGIYNNSEAMLTVSNSTISGSEASFNGGGIYNSGNLEVSNSTLNGNSAQSSGGGISSNGVSTVSNSILSGNSARTNGGGIYNNGGISTVTNSTISGNSAGLDGGGIYNLDNSGTSTVSNSTIIGNSASGGGGISSFGRTLTVSSSTISDNSAGIGGGIFNLGVILLSNSTLSSNSAGIGGGIYNSFGTLTLVFSTVTLNQAANGGGAYNQVSNNTSGSISTRNTIIAANLKKENGINPDVSGTFTSNGYNLIGDDTGSTGFDETIGDIVGTSLNPIDPRLAPLDFNGGSTQTLALLPDSSAIGAADPTLLDTDPITDQRGFSRRATNGTADIGAFEFS